MSMVSSKSNSSVSPSVKRLAQITKRHNKSRASSKSKREVHYHPKKNPGKKMDVFNRLYQRGKTKERIRRETSEKRPKLKKVKRTSRSRSNSRSRKVLNHSKSTVNIETDTSCFTARTNKSRSKARRTKSRQLTPQTKAKTRKASRIKEHEYNGSIGDRLYLLSRSKSQHKRSSSRHGDR